MSNIREMVGQGGRDFNQPVECRGHDLADVIAEANAAGYHAHSMTVKDIAVYRLRFWRLDAPQGTAEDGSLPEKIKESPKAQPATKIERLS